MTEYQILQHFPSWREAVRAAGLEPDLTNIELADSVLLEDWGELVRKLRHIPTRQQYRQHGRYSPRSFEKHFGAWSKIPETFRQYAVDNPSWADVIALLPQLAMRAAAAQGYTAHSGSSEAARPVLLRHLKLKDRST